ncbi:uncharacterized protein LOC144934131 [Lampetra fluviatilis]
MFRAHGRPFNKLLFFFHSIAGTNPRTRDVVAKSSVSVGNSQYTPQAAVHLNKVAANVPHITLQESRSDVVKRENTGEVAYGVYGTPTYADKEAASSLLYDGSDFEKKIISAASDLPRTTTDNVIPEKQEEDTSEAYDASPLDASTEFRGKTPETSIGDGTGRAGFSTEKNTTSITASISGGPVEQHPVVIFEEGNATIRDPATQVHVTSGATEVDVFSEAPFPIGHEREDIFSKAPFKPAAQDDIFRNAPFVKKTPRGSLPRASAHGSPVQVRRADDGAARPRDVGKEGSAAQAKDPTRGVSAQGASVGHERRTIPQKFSADIADLRARAQAHGEELARNAVAPPAVKARAPASLLDSVSVQPFRPQALARYSRHHRGDDGGDGDTHGETAAAPASSASSPQRRRRANEPPVSAGPHGGKT